MLFCLHWVSCQLLLVAFKLSGCGGCGSQTLHDLPFPPLSWNSGWSSNICADRGDKTGFFKTLFSASLLFSDRLSLWKTWTNRRHLHLSITSISSSFLLSLNVSFFALALPLATTGRDNHSWHQLMELHVIYVIIFLIVSERLQQGKSPQWLCHLQTIFRATNVQPAWMSL